MNEFERRVLDLAQNHVNLRRASLAEGRLSIIEYFGYSTQIGSPTDVFAVNTSRQAIIPIQSDSYFVLSYIIAGNLSFGFIDKVSSISLQITDTGAGATLYSTPAPADLLIGSVSPQTSGIPLLLAVPRVIRPNTNIKIDMTNFGLNASDGIFISLIGAKVFTI